MPGTRANLGGVLRRQSFYARHEERRRREVVRRLRRDVPELREAEPVSIRGRAGALAAGAIPVIAGLAILLVRA